MSHHPVPYLVLVTLIVLAILVALRHVLRSPPARTAEDIRAEEAADAELQVRYPGWPLSMCKHYELMRQDNPITLWGEVPVTAIDTERRCH